MFEKSFTDKIFAEVKCREYDAYGANREMAISYPNDYTAWGYMNFPVMQVCCKGVTPDYFIKTCGLICPDMQEVINSIVKKEGKNLDDKELRVSYYMRTKVRSAFSDYFAGDCRLEVEDEGLNLWFE